MQFRAIFPLFAILLLCTPRIADAKGKKRQIHHHTVIEAVSATSITIHTTNEKSDDAKTFTITKDTAINFDGQTITGNQLEVGERVDVTPDGADDTVAAVIAATDSPHDPTPSRKKK